MPPPRHLQSPSVRCAVWAWLGKAGRREGFSLYSYFQQEQEGVGLSVQLPSVLDGHAKLDRTGVHCYLEVAAGPSDHLLRPSFSVLLLALGHMK